MEGRRMGEWGWCTMFSARGRGREGSRGGVTGGEAVEAGAADVEGAFGWWWHCYGGSG